MRPYRVGAAFMLPRAQMVDFLVRNLDRQVRVVYGGLLHGRTAQGPTGAGVVVVGAGAARMVSFCVALVNSPDVVMTGLPGAESP